MIMLLLAIDLIPHHIIMGYNRNMNGKCLVAMGNKKVCCFRHFPIYGPFATLKTAKTNDFTTFFIQKTQQVSVKTGNSIVL